MRDFDEVSRILNMRGGLYFREEVKSRVLRAAEEGRPFVFLDLGCAWGNAAETTHRYARHVLTEAKRPPLVESTGLDLKTPRFLGNWIRFLMGGVESYALARDNGHVARSFLRGDLRVWPQAQLRDVDLSEPLSSWGFAPNSADVTISIEVAPFIPDGLRFIERAWEVTRSGGLVCMTFNADWVAKNPGLDQVLDETPGARDAFELTHTPKPGGGRSTTLVGRKEEASTFTGFPFRSTGVSRGTASKKSPHHQFYRRSDYERVGE